MTRVSLSDTSDWQLSNDDQDIRGFEALNGAGDMIGIVDSLLVDTDAELVTTIVLDNGTEIPVADVTIGEGVVYTEGSVPGAATAGVAAAGMATDSDSVRSGVTVFDDGGRVVRRERVEGAGTDTDAHDADFREHHTTAFGASGRSYDDVSEAYRHGYTSAHADDNRNRSYADAEAGLRSGYPDGRDFDADREAVRYGYGRAPRRTR